MSFNIGKILAIVNIGLSFSVAVGYLFVGDYRRAIYWTAGSVITSSVTF